MNDAHASILNKNLDAESLAKLTALDNEKLHAFVAGAIELCQPDAVLVCDDSPEDIAKIRQLAKDNSEETPLATDGHTYHFDGPTDQGRDPRVTKYLLPEGVDLGKRFNSMDRDEGLGEINGIFAGCMKGRTMYVRFLSLGPTNSVFSISCVQITDSAYVCHSEDMLYRPGYEQFKKLGDSGEFFRFQHCTGPVDDRMTCTDIENKRVYIDIMEDMVFSCNTQYAGNTVGLKKLALRLAIRKADREGWLSEHMFVMGVKGPSGRKTYFTGAYPSACGKTSTAMIPGETIIGDDLAYLREVNGEVRCVNAEAGIFGIIQDVNAKDDPVIFDLLQQPGEVIFGNVLISDGKPYWSGMGSETASEGENFQGKWHTAKINGEGNEIPPSHKNARYTVRLGDLTNVDENWDNPEGVTVGGIMYGGRDSDTCVPVQESFDWVHGVTTMGASLESETTAATIGAEGIRKFDLMSIMQFVAIPLGKYIQNNLDFGPKLTDAPKIFGTNYFLKNAEGGYLNGKLDKSVWVKWMELRVHGDVDGIEAPTGTLPKYEDLAKLFKQVLDKDYSQEDYVEQFTIRIPENLAKLQRVESIYRDDVEDTPQAVFDGIVAQRSRLEALQAAKGDYVSPLDL